VRPPVTLLERLGLRGKTPSGLALTCKHRSILKSVSMTLIPEFRSVSAVRREPTADLGTAPVAPSLTLLASTNAQNTFKITRYFRKYVHVQAGHK
jgi:hypothetical protein